MKFNCGPTWEEKYDAKVERLSDWHRFFAIWPRRVGPRDCRWLEFIERRGTRYLGTALGVEGQRTPIKVWKWSWDYRAVEDKDE